MLNVSNQAFEQKRLLKIQLLKKYRIHFLILRIHTQNKWLTRILTFLKITPKTLIKSFDIVYFLHKRFVLWQNDDLFFRESMPFSK